MKISGAAPFSARSRKFASLSSPLTKGGLQGGPSPSSETSPSPSLARRGEETSTAADSGCGLYVHTPFCETKCGYCDFYSVALKDRDTAPLVGAIIRELEHRIADSAYEIRTIFCGGGTPTLLPIDQLARLLTAIGNVVPVDRVDEFTVEANPATVDDAKAELLAVSGVTRVSMGAQSFFADELETLERLHSPDDIAPSIATLRRHGFGRINLDLIFGIPGQSLDTWSQSLQKAIDLGADHIACYGLTYEPKTRLTAQRNTGRVTPCDENLEADMFMLTIETLTAAGFRQYEISNFAKPGEECLHKLIYWRNKPYIGVGPSAAGCVDGRRYKNVADVNGYVRMIEQNSQAEQESETIGAETLMHELIMMQLRLNEGLSVREFQARTGSDPMELFGDTLSRMRDQRFVRVSDARIALTRAGQLVANAVIAELIAICTSDAPTLRVLG